nr:MAG TPA: Endodeoxyribonuclease RusA [Caudoviricetes sp.]
MTYQYTIPLPPVSKKNSQRILINRRTGRPFIKPSAAYEKYEGAAMWYLNPKPRTPIAAPCRVMTVFYMPTRRACDLSNLIESAHDVLVKAKIIADDNYKIIDNVDGSRVRYDKDNPRTEIIIEELDNE